MPVCDVCLLVRSAIADDPRVRKQGNLLSGMGLRVVGVGRKHAKRQAPDWPVVEADDPLPDGGRSAARWTRRIVKPAARLSPRLAEALYWRLPVYASLARAAQDVRARVYVANDWDMLPLARRLAACHGGVYAYDSHEYAAQELPESPRWRLIQQGFVMQLEGAGIRDASLVSTVSDGISRRLQADHGLARRPLTVRNVPERSGLATPFAPVREADAAIRVLFHGGMTRFRGVHHLVESVLGWQPGCELVLRGPVDDTYGAELGALVARPELRGRVTIEPPVDPAELISRASAFDVGAVCLPDSSMQNRLALPNKLFEYAHAGLAILAPDLPEIARIVRSSSNGAFFAELSASSIANAVNALDRAEIERLKAGSRAAAPLWVWEDEASDWADLIAALAKDGTTAGHAPRNRAAR